MWHRPDSRRKSGDAYTTRVSNRGIQGFPMTMDIVCKSESKKGGRNIVSVTLILQVGP